MDDSDEDENWSRKGEKSDDSDEDDTPKKKRYKLASITYKPVIGMPEKRVAVTSSQEPAVVASTSQKPAVENSLDQAEKSSSDEDEDLEVNDEKRNPMEGIVCSIKIECKYAIRMY